MGPRRRYGVSILNASSRSLSNILLYSAEELVDLFWQKLGWPKGGGAPQDLSVKKAPPARKPTKSASVKSTSASAPVKSSTKRKTSSKKEKESASASVSVGGASASDGEGDEDEGPAKKKSKNASNGRKSKKLKKEDAETLELTELPEDIVKLASWEGKITDIATVEEQTGGQRQVLFRLYVSV